MVFFLNKFIWEIKEKKKMKHWLVKMERALDKVFMTLKNKIEKQKHTRKRGWSSNTKAYYNLYYKKKKKKKKKKFVKF